MHPSEFELYAFTLSDICCNLLGLDVGKTFMKILASLGFYFKVDLDLLNCGL